MKYNIALTKNPDGWFTAQCLEVPGAISQGETKEAALENATEALSLVLGVIREETSRLKARLCVLCKALVI
ncbi:MAG TPA: type II toxin-antitoxin system HicB family antitoxin [archaeon]|nr:type II toxin-antitoxin system HicB family antitoxin [archaeon]